MLLRWSMLLQITSLFLTSTLLSLLLICCRILILTFIIAVVIYVLISHELNFLCHHKQLLTCRCLFISNHHTITKIGSSIAIIVWIFTFNCRSVVMILKGPLLNVKLLSNELIFTPIVIRIILNLAILFGNSILIKLLLILSLDLIGNRLLWNWGSLRFFKAQLYLITYLIDVIFVLINCRFF